MPTIPHVAEFILNFYPNSAVTEKHFELLKKILRKFVGIWYEFGGNIARKIEYFGIFYKF